MNAHMLAAVRAFRRLLHVHRALFERIANGAEDDSTLGPADDRAEVAAFQYRLELAHHVAGRYRVGVGALDLAVVENEWTTYERTLRARERARAQEPDPIRDAIGRAAVQLFADLDLVAVICQQCKTELAFPGDVCGLCKPGELPRLM